MLSDGPVDGSLLASLNAATRNAGPDGVWVPLPAVYEGESPADVVTAFRRIGVAGYAVLGAAQNTAQSALDRIEPPPARQAKSTPYASTAMRSSAP